MVSERLSPRNTVGTPQVCGTLPTMNYLNWVYQCQRLCPSFSQHCPEHKSLVIVPQASICPPPQAWGPTHTGLSWVLAKQGRAFLSSSIHFLLPGCPSCSVSGPWPGPHPKSPTHSVSKASWAVSPWARYFSDPPLSALQPGVPTIPTTNRTSYIKMPREQ